MNHKDQKLGDLNCPERTRHA